MGYIKKLKNNELVGGTDKTTIYPVTSTEAVFEEITNGNESSFKSQKTINKEQQDELDDHEERIQAAEAEDIKSITINGSTKEFRVDDNNNVDLTIYTVDSDPDMPDIADNVRDLRNMVGTSTPVLETSHKTRIETLEGDESVTGSVENKIKTKVDSINSSYQDDDNEYVKYSMIQTSGKVTDFNIDETSLKNAITSLNTSISGDNIVIRSGSTPSGTGEAGKIYRYVNSGNNTYTDYMYSGGSWIALATHDTSNEQAQVAYYTCTATGSGAQTTKQFVSNGSIEYTPSSGGHIKILMGEANTATGTIYLQYNTDATNTKKPLYYNGEPVSPSNTWDAGETIAVYYDPSANSNAGAYFASNAQGGGGKAEKVKYDNSESGIPFTNVQDAIDDVEGSIVNLGLEVGDDADLGTALNFSIQNDKWKAKTGTGTKSQACNIIKVEGGEFYEITGRTEDSNTSPYAWLTTNVPVDGATPDYLEGYEGNYLVQPNQTITLKVPQGAEYLYLARVVNGNGRLPSSVKKMVAVKDKVDALESSVYGEGWKDKYVHTFAGNTDYRTDDVYINSQLKVLTGSNKISFFFEIKNAKAFTITANESNATLYAFVNRPYASGDVVADALPEDYRTHVIPANETVYVDNIPNGAKYIYIGMKENSSTSRTPQLFMVHTDVGSGANATKKELNAVGLKDGESVVYTANQVLNLVQYPVRRGFVDGDSKWFLGVDDIHHILIPIGNATEITITANSSVQTGCSFLSDGTFANNNYPVFAIGETGRHEITADTTEVLEVPEGAVWLEVNASNGTGGNLLPASITVTGIDANYVPQKVSEFDDISKNSTDIKAMLGPYEAADGDMNLNINQIGREDGAICYWWYPHIITTSMPHKRIYYSYCDTYGGTGVACVNGFDKRAWKTVLKRMLNNGEIDLHNTASIQMLSDKRLICIYTEGHAQTNYMHIRVSKRPEDITEWDYTAFINWGGKATYAQYYYVNGKHYVFSRVGVGGSNTNSWGYVCSTDLKTWSEPHIFIQQPDDYQLYIWLKPIADEPNMLRFISYTNPAYPDTNIRCGIIDFENDKVYKHDGTTELTGSVNDTAGLEGTYSSSQFDVLVAKPSSGKQRLFDLAVTNLDTIRIAYGRQSSLYVGNYHVYENVSGVENDATICAAGDVLFNHNDTLSQCGICFVDKDTLFVSRSSQDSTGYDYMEIYKRGETGWAFDKEVYKELKGADHYRNAYPIADPNGRYVMWMRGFLSQDTYAGSITDIIIYDVEKDEVF